MEGTVTGEHGVGLVKRDYLPHEVGESTVDAMRRVSLDSILIDYLRMGMMCSGPYICDFHFLDYSY